jgi:hypothetical protein
MCTRHLACKLPPPRFHKVDRQTYLPWVRTLTVANGLKAPNFIYTNLSKPYPSTGTTSEWRRYNPTILAQSPPSISFLLRAGNVWVPTLSFMRIDGRLPTNPGRQAVAQSRPTMCIVKMLRYNTACYCYPLSLIVQCDGMDEPLSYASIRVDVWV